MEKIIKFDETMTPKERVRKTFLHEKTDRVTIGYDSNPNIHARLAVALGLEATDKEGVLQALGVDYRGISAKYIGKRLFADIPNRQVHPLEGCVTRYVEHETGSYWDHCDFPLKDAEDEDFENFPIPDPEDFDYDSLPALAKSHAPYAVYAANIGVPDIINSNGRVMGMEDLLCHLQFETPSALDFIRRRADYQLKVLERTLESCKGHLDFVWLGEDLGTQTGPLLNPQLYKKLLKPIHKLFVDLAKSHDLPVLIHTCGSSEWAYEDFIEIGISGVDTLQPEATNMSPKELKAKFSNRLSYRGCISTAGPLAYGTPGEVEQVCKETLEIMMQGGGYHFAPTHAIQDNTPTENVIAMYNAAHKHGRY